jgi:hypothetical protein
MVPSANCQHVASLADEPLTAEDIAEMMAEAARVDHLFQTGQISTLFTVQLLSHVSSNRSPIDSRPAAALSGTMHIS